MAEPIRLTACPLCGSRQVQPDGVIRSHHGRDSHMRCSASRRTLAEVEAEEE